jgi:uncharacterized protein (TIGR02145 family)
MKNSKFVILANILVKVAIAILFLFTIMNLMPANLYLDENSYTDPRDGQVYETVEIENNIWFKENLKYQTTHSICYDNLVSNCEKYGMLYPYNEALTACPEYWRLPDHTDVEKLYSLMGNQKIKMIAEPGEWNVRSGKKFNNSVGLSVLPAGRIDSFSFYSIEKEKWIDTMAFHQKGIAASFWLNDIENSEGVLHWHIGTPIGEIKSDMHRHRINLEEHKFSIRCLCEKSQKK